MGNMCRKSSDPSSGPVMFPHQRRTQTPRLEGRLLRPFRSESQRRQREALHHLLHPLDQRALRPRVRRNLLLASLRKKQLYRAPQQNQREHLLAAVSFQLGAEHHQKHSPIEKSVEGRARQDAFEGAFACQRTGDPLRPTGDPGNVRQAEGNTSNDPDRALRFGERGTENQLE